MNLTRRRFAAAAAASLILPATGALAQTTGSVSRAQRHETFTTEELVVQALITDHRSSSPSPHQIRAARVALRALAEAGLALCSAQGTWLASTRPTRKHVEQSRAEFDMCQEHVEAERIAYRSGRSSAWNIWDDWPPAMT